MGKSSRIRSGFHYKPAFHQGLTRTIDAYLAWTVADKFAWQGELTGSGTVTVSKPFLFGGTKDQGGVEGELELMFGEATQMPNAYLSATFGPQQQAWRGLTTMVWKGGRYGANNPYAHKNASKIRKILKGWDNDDPWYPETAEIRAAPRIMIGAWRHVEMSCDGSTVRLFVEGKLKAEHTLDFVPNGGMGGQTTIGMYSALDGDPCNAYLENVRVTKAVRHTADFIPSQETPSDENDPHWDDVLIMLPMDGVDGSTVFTDAKGNTWTQTGAAAISTEKFIGGGASGKFTGGRIELPYDVDLNVGSQFTVDFWINANALAGWAITVNQLASFHAGYSVGVKSDGAVQVVFGRNTWPAAPVILQENIESPIIGMNPAHILVYSRTDSERGREPFANINEASLTAAADKLYSEGFGICTEYDPANESPSEFEQRICRLIGGSFERSITDGQWYLDLARGDYVLEDLPILTDDDILDFREQPSTLDRAVNSLSVRYFDPERKETIVTPAIRALGLVRKFGEIHETLDFPEIPIADLALRVAKRELLSRVTPTRGFKKVTTPRTYAWRPNTYYRLQSTKRGIADMVCIIGQKTRGTLKSGAIDMVTAQDIYSLPDSSYVEVEPGVDPSPPQVPGVIEVQRADEVPYFELAGRLPRAELAALPADAGYVMAVASDPDEGRDYTMMVAPDGGEFDEAGTGYWSPTATTLAAAGVGTTVVELDEIYLLDQVEIGAPALWDDEIVRVDAKDMLAGTVNLGRGCADTVPPPEHAAGSRIWFYDLHAASDTTEYTDGETVEVRLLTNTGSDQLDIGLATPMDVTLDQRAYRPYPPGQLRINDDPAPSYAFGVITVEWTHRDRVLQADQLVDTEAASIGPEPGTTYTMRLYINDVLQNTVAGVTGATATIDAAVDGSARLEVEALRDGVTSWQMHVREFAYTVAEADPWELQGGGVLQEQSAQTIYLVG